jgi:cold-inducible RNA-binding protein
MNLYVSNLSYTLTDNELRSAFEAFGQVASARVIFDRETNRSRGFGFVEMPNDKEANAAIGALNGQDREGRPLRVVEARPQEPRPAGGSTNRGGGGGARRDAAPSRSYGDDGGGSRGGGGGGRRDGGGGGRDRGWDRNKRDRNFGEDGW